MQLSEYRFRPGLIPTLATILVFPVLVALGFWQLDRAEQKEQAQADFETRSERPVLDLNLDNPDPQADLFRLAEARGSYDPDRQFLLDNQVRNRQVGYHVLTPFRIEGRDGLALLVDRGWVSAGTSRSELPSLPAPEDVDLVHGHLDQGPTTGIRLGELAEGDTGWPLRVQYVDFDEMAEHLGYSLLPVVLRLDENAPGGFQRDWRPQHPTGFGPDRNRGYAFQWFGLAATLAIIYLVVNLRRRQDGEHDDQQA